jgi:hypothetical protein
VNVIEFAKAIEAGAPKNRRLRINHENRFNKKHDEAYIMFYNLPTKLKNERNVDEANNRLFITVSGFPADPNEDAKGKVKLAQTIGFHRFGKLRGKSAPPEKLVKYITDFLHKAASENQMSLQDPIYKDKTNKEIEAMQGATEDLFTPRQREIVQASATVDVSEAKGGAGATHLLGQLDANNWQALTDLSRGFSGHFAALERAARTLIKAGKVEQKMDPREGVMLKLKTTTEEVDADYARQHAATNPEGFDRIFSQLKPKQTVWMAYEGYGMGSSSEGKYVPFTVGRRSVSKKFGVVSIGLNRRSDPDKKDPFGRSSRLNAFSLRKRKDGPIQLALGDMAMKLVGLYLEK